jgi:hypothetical protein
VIAEFQSLSLEMQHIIADITLKMGAGMAEFAAKDTQGVDTIKDYELVRSLEFFFSSSHTVLPLCCRSCRDWIVAALFCFWT